MPLKKKSDVIQSVIINNYTSNTCNLYLNISVKCNIYNVTPKTEKSVISQVAK